MMTDRVFIRFAESVVAESRSGEIECAGYRIVKTVPYAPQAVWVEPMGPGNLDALRQLPDMESVEPQLLMPRGNREG